MRGDGWLRRGRNRAWRSGSVPLMRASQDEAYGPWPVMSWMWSILHDPFHPVDLIIGQEVEMAGAFGGGEPIVVLKAEADEQIDLPIRHINDTLDSSLGAVVPGQEGQFVHQFVINRLFDEGEHRLRLGRHVDVTIPEGRVVVHGHATIFVQGIVHQRHERLGEGLPGKRHRHRDSSAWRRTQAASQLPRLAARTPPSARIL